MRAGCAAWSRDELRELKRLVRGGYSDRQIADAMNRPLASIKVRRWRLKLPPNSVNYARWLPDEVAQLKRLVWEGKKDYTVSRLLGRPVVSVRAKRSRLGLNRHRRFDSIVRRLAACGRTDAQIGREIGMSTSGVWWIRSRLGVTAGSRVKNCDDASALPRCWECDRLAPYRTNSQLAGWHSRRHGGRWLFELYCPGCFESIGGWDGVREKKNVQKRIA